MGNSFNPVFYEAYPNVIGPTVAKYVVSDGMSYSTVDCWDMMPTVPPIRVDPYVFSTDGELPTIDHQTWFEAMNEMNATTRMSWKDPWLESCSGFFTNYDSLMESLVGKSIFISHGSEDGAGSDYFAEVSGNVLKLQMDHLGLLREAQRVLDAKIEAAQKHWPKCLEIVFDIPLVCDHILALYTALRSVVVKKTIKVLRHMQAVKREMRRRQYRVRPHFTRSQRAWYLLHGTHPPEAQSIFNAEFQLRRG